MIIAAHCVRDRLPTPTLPSHHWLLWVTLDPSGTQTETLSVNPTFPPTDGLERMRSPSAGNLSQPQYVPAHPQEPGNHNRREFDPRSKSTSNLHVDTSFEKNDPHASMRGATSVGMLLPGVPGYPQYSPGGRRPDIRPNDYENQPQVGGIQCSQSHDDKPPPTSRNSSLRRGAGLWLEGQLGSFTFALSEKKVAWRNFLLLNS